MIKLREHSPSWEWRDGCGREATMVDPAKPYSCEELGMHRSSRSAPSSGGRLQSTEVIRSIVLQPQVSNGSDIDFSYIFYLLQY